VVIKWLRSDTRKIVPAPAESARAEAKRLDVLDVAAGTRGMIFPRVSVM
jgi:hypothetical protein